MNGEASVNCIRRQLDRARELMGPVEVAYTEPQKEWLATMRDRLRSRIEQRRERIALAILNTHDPDGPESFTAKILRVEEILDKMEVQSK